MSVELFFLHVFQWLGGTWAASKINDSEWLFPIIESLHISGLAVLIGTVAIVDFRLLGLVLPNRPVPQIARELRAWTLAGMAVNLTTGPLMISAEPERGPGNPAFEFKMLCLMLALLNHFTVHRWATKREWASGTTSGTALGGKLAACLSLALWTCVVLGGRAIAFF